MEHLTFAIDSQPDEWTCGPTCLHAVYRYFGDGLPLSSLIAEVSTTESGGTFAVLLACHALRRGYSATLYTYNLQLFDPTWFASDVDLSKKLAAQMKAKHDPQIEVATKGYLEFFRLGGKVRFEVLSAKLIRQYLSKGLPILTGLSSTYLYQNMREHGPNGDEDDVRGLPVGHFVVMCGYRKQERRVLVADPLQPNPLSDERIYEVGIDRAICAILLGILTFDANLLILEPAAKVKRASS